MRIRPNSNCLAQYALLLVAALWLPIAFAQHVDTTQVFRIGTFDRSSGEFAGGTPKHLINFMVGRDDSAKAWYATQRVEPASAEGTHRSVIASAPRTIRFYLKRAPAVAYRIHVSLLIESPGVPAVRLGINEKQGTFYLRPKLDYDAGDVVDAFDPIYSHADIQFAFPGTYLRKGLNTITLQAIGESETPVPNASLTYDAIELDRFQNRVHSPASFTQILPTIFYREHGNQLEEIVEVLIRRDGRTRAGGNAKLSIAGMDYHQTLRGGPDFGEEKLEFSIPEFPPHTQARLSWKIGGHRRQKQEFISPRKKWTLFLVPHIHVDIGYSDYRPKVAAIQSRVLDEAMDFTKQHPNFVFSTDGEWNLQQFFKTRSPAEKQRIVAAIHKKQICIPAQYANLLTGFSTAETLIRALYPSANFSREHGTPFNYANITDVPSYSWSYASILASAGIKDFLAASDNYRGPVLLEGRLNEDSPMWWEGPDGEKVLFWYSRHYSQMEYLFGLPPDTSAGRNTLPIFLQMYDRPDYLANAAIIFGTQLENTDLFPQQAELASQWNASYAYPQIRYSGVHHALETIARQFGDRLPTVRGDGGPYWEDEIASDAYYATLERENESRGPSAEKLATLSSLVDSRVAADKAGLDRMWQNMVLMDEHTATSYNAESEPKSDEAVQQLAAKNLYAVKAHALGDWVARSSMASIANSISAGRGSLIVFNTLNWSRKGFVSFDLKDGDEIVDAATGQPVPFAVELKGHGFRQVRFLAQDVPAVGYKVYLLHHAQKPATAGQTTRNTVLESPYYRVELDPAMGVIKSIYDKQLHRELVNPTSPYRFGQYLYVTGGDHEPNSLMAYRPLSPKPNLTIYPANNGVLISTTRTPFGWTAIMKCSDKNTPEIKTQIRLFNHEKKIEIVENIDKEKVDTKEGVYFAFPFAMDHPRFQYEIQNGVVNPAKDMYAGAGYEWFSVQHWVSVEEAGISGTVMPLDASLVTLGDINRGAWPRQFGERTGTIFSYIMNNYRDTGHAAGQGGHFRFRYIITSAASTNPVKLSRMGWEEMTPLEMDEVTSQDKAIDSPRPLSGKQATFLEVADPNLMLDTWKPAEDGNGTILRFIDLGGVSRTVTVRTPLLNLTQVWLTDAVERNKKSLPITGRDGFQFAIQPHAIVTVRVAGKDLLP